MPTSDEARSWTRRFLLVAFVVAAAICGLAAGTWIGARFFVPAGSGLAGPAIALGYGGVGALMVGLLAGLAIWWMPVRWLARLGVVVGAVAVVLVGSMSWALWQARIEQRAHLEQAYAQLPPFEVVLEGVAGAPVKRIEYASAANRFAVRRADGSLCSATLSGAQKSALLGALRNVEVLVSEDSEPCAGAPPTRRLGFRIFAVKPPETRVDVALHDACLAKRSALRDAVGALESIHAAVRSQLACVAD